jgi:hypothetical protein
MAAAGLGAAVSGGSVTGAATAFNIDANNRQLHPTERQWIQQNARRFAQAEGITEEQAMERLTQQALRNVDFLWRAQLADGDDAAAKAFLNGAQQTFTNDLGEAQRLFTASGQQLLRPEMFADTADPLFYRHYAQSGISRSLSAGLMKELKDSGVALKDGAIDLFKLVQDNPSVVVDAVWKAVTNLPQALKDSLVETGHAIGEGGAVALNADISAKLNAIYGRDVAGYQQTLLAIRTLTAATGAAGVAKTGGKLTEEAAKAIGKKLDDVADDLARGTSAERQALVQAEQAAVKARVEINARVDDGQQYDHFRNSSSSRPGGEWDWQKHAPNNGAVPGTQQTVIIKAGDTLDRFGLRDGEYMSPAGTPYEARALPPGKRAEPYEQYTVLKPFIVVKEEIAPAFNQPGGGVQMRAQIPEVQNGFATIHDLILHGYLKDPKK